MNRFLKRVCLLTFWSIAVFAGATFAEPFDLSKWSFPDLAGDEASLDRWQGKILALNFWATWCSPCLQEMPELVALQSAYGDKGLQFVGIAVETDASQVAMMAEKLSVNYPVLVDEDVALELASALGNSDAAMPFTVIFDRSGEVIFHRKGTVGFEEISALVEPLL